MKVKIHPSAEISEKVNIGQGTSIWQNCIIQEDVSIGENCNIGANVFLEKGVTIGCGVKIKNNVALYTGVECEDDVFLGPNCVFTNVINPRSFINRKEEFKKTVVKKGATIGANATIICGHTIGEYAFIGAGAVVTKDVPAYSLLVGNPAKQIGFVCKCACKLDEQENRYVCTKCGKNYEKTPMGMEEIR